MISLHESVQKLALPKRIITILLENGIWTTSQLAAAASSDQLANLPGLYPDDVSLIEEIIRSIDANIDLPAHTFVDELDLSIRAKNVLLRNHVITVDQLLATDKDTLLRFKGMGTKMLREIECCLDEHLAKRPMQYSLVTSKLLVHVSGAAGTNTVISTSLSERWQIITKTVRAEVNKDCLHREVRVEGYTIAHLMNSKDVSFDQGIARRVVDAITKALAFNTVSEELLDLFQGISPDRIWVFVLRLGPEKRTLEEIGQERHVTRERVRQIVGRVEQKISERLSTRTYLRIQTTFAIARDMGPEITYSAWKDRITTSNLLGHWTPETAKRMPEPASPQNLLLSIANLSKSRVLSFPYRLPENLSSVLGRGDLSAQAVKLVAQISKSERRAIRRQAQNGGAVYAKALAESLSITLKEACSLLIGLGYEHISHDWYSLSVSGDNNQPDRLRPVFHAALKMLKVCGPLDVKDICHGLRRRASRGGYYIPPPSVMAQMLVRHGFSLRDGKAEWPFQNSCTPSPSEYLVLNEIDQRGPVVTHFELLQAFTQAGLSIPALSMTLRYSPLFYKVGMGLYALRGRTVTQGEVASAQKRQPVTAADPEVIFQITGIVRFRLNLGSIAISSGVIYTTHVPNLAGTWPSRCEDIHCGNVIIRDNQIWGLSRAFRVIKAEVGDRIEFQFDTWNRSVNILKVSHEDK